MSFELDELLAAGAAGNDGDADHFVVAADHFLALGQPKAALTALDRAYGLRPEDPNIATQRRELLDAQTVVEHGMTFRYVPAGTFLMGSTTGDPDEQPVHAVRLDEFWIADVPISWARFCALMDWTPPPEGMPRHELEGDSRFYLYEANKLRRFYCDLDEDAEESDFDRRPMVAVSRVEAEELSAKLSTATTRYSLPSEAEWEKAARGGLIAQPYPWGSAPPSPVRCDCDHFGRWELGNPRTLPANGYGLHGMSGGVWEWTRTVYDALGYSRDDSIATIERLQELGEELEARWVLRGGSWADAAAAVTVSFRHALIGRSWRQGWTDAFNPNVGFRLIRRLR